MRIAFYMPFKPLGHPRPSGDLVIGTELFEYLQRKGHDIRLASRLRCRWIYWKPWIWPALVAETIRIGQRSQRWFPDLWLSYHAYYKAPDLLGFASSRLLDIPYVVFQGVYSTKQRRRFKARPGFYLNRLCLLSASAVLTNKQRDHVNLRRLVPPSRLHYVKPGIRLARFQVDAASRSKLRRQWQAGARPVIITAAMFRPGVKTQGVLEVIRTCRALRQEGLDFLLLIVGDGSEKDTIRQAVQRGLADRFLMTGRVPREQLYRYYSAADLFVFPGIQEGLGLVYLEAQACGLPVVAYGDWGAAEVVVHGQTGHLTPAHNLQAFAAAIRKLMKDQDLRVQMGRTAQRHVRAYHDMACNYQHVNRILALARSSYRRKADGGKHR